MWLEIASAVWLAGNAIYYRWIKDKPAPPPPLREFSIPRTEEGTPVALVFGRVRVEQPWLAFVSDPTVTEASPPYQYWLYMFFVLGIRFGPESENKLHMMFIGSQPTNASNVVFEDMTGDGSFELPGAAIGGAISGEQVTVGEMVEFLNGKPDQLLVEDSAPYAALTWAGNRMRAAAGSGDIVPSFRGYLSVFLHNAGQPWSVGSSPQPGAYSFECSSYPTAAVALGPANKIGDDCNPADVLLSLITGTFGKLGIPIAYVDLDSFEDAAATLDDEGNGYSRVIDQAASAQEIIGEVLRQTDGTLFQNPDTGKVVYKLIRGDYDAASALLVHPQNCVNLLDWEQDSGDETPNFVRVMFTNRLRNYEQDSAVAHDMANAVGQDNQIREVVLRFPGCTTKELAEALAARELSYLSRPLAKCRAIVDRSFYRTVPGDVVAVTWPEYGLDQKLFRVAAVDRGMLMDNKISLSLIEDHFFSHRGSKLAALVAPFPTVIGLA